jgi:hypothetical protein
VKKWIAIVFGLICLVFPFFATQSDQIVSINLSKMVSMSDVAFKGTCESRELKTISLENYPNPINTGHYVFLIEDVLKGNLKIGDHFEFDQVNETREDARLKKIPYVGTVEYEVGKPYVILLSGPSQTTGLRFPVAAAQGVFDVTYDTTGKATVVNRFSNKGLFQESPQEMSISKALKAAHIDESKVQKGPISYDDFKAIVKQMR